MNAAKPDCPPRLDLAAWASTDTISSEPSSPMHTHVQSCPKCSLYVQALQDARQEPLSLAIVSKRGEALFPISDGDEVLAGDRLRFEYTQARPGFLMVFSVDDQGTVSPYYDDNRLQSVPVTAGFRIALPGSVELDDHKGVERVFALWSPRPLEASAVQAAVNQALAQAGGNVANVLKLPVQAEQTSVLLRRP